MAKMTNEEKVESIGDIEDIGRLARIIACEQSDSWYDPCGKSGSDLNTRLTPASAACVRKIHSLMGLGKLT